MAKMQIALRVNNRQVETLVEPRMLLIHLLREELGMTGPHMAATPVIAAPARST